MTVKQPKRRSTCKPDWKEKCNVEPNNTTHLVGLGLSSSSVLRNNKYAQVNK